MDCFTGGSLQSQSGNGKRSDKGERKMKKHIWKIVVAALVVIWIWTFWSDRQEESRRSRSDTTQTTQTTQSPGGINIWDDGGESQMCTSCRGVGSCSLCYGTGTYRNYGESGVCTACGGTGRCGMCGGTGWD